MLATLRRRLILSHVLPLLLTVPVIGIALVYVLGTQVLVPSISRDLAEQASLVAEIAADHPTVWQDPGQARALLARLDPDLTAQTTLLDHDGRLLASDDPLVVPASGPVLKQADIATLLAGHQVLHTTYSRSLDADLIVVLAPVVNAQGRVIGIVRLTHRLVGLVDRFARLRYLIAGVLAAASILGILLGWLLALNLAAPLRRVTEAVYELAGRPAESGQAVVADHGRTQVEPGAGLPEQGPVEIRLLLRAVNTLVQRRRAAEQNRRQLLANLVHELARPLGALGSAIQALAGGAVEEPALRDELLAGMAGEVQRLRRLIDDLARLQDQETGKIELTRRLIALATWLPGVLATWREAAEAQSLAWTADIRPGLPTISADPDRLAQALGNLLSNAIKYTPPGGRVYFAAGCAPAPDGLRSGQDAPATAPGQGTDDAWVWLQVSDTGPGIPAADQGWIFEPFYRCASDAGGRRCAPGMGLGLAIARDLVQAHGGQLTVTSAPGQGSAFVIWVPARAAGALPVNELLAPAN